MRKLLAFLIAAALVFPLILAAQTLVSVDSFILDRDFYIETLASDKTYDSFIENETLSGFLGKYIPLPANTDFSRVEGVIKSVITREYLKEQVGIFVNGFFDYIQGKTDDFAPVINLVPIKTALAEQKLDEMLVEIAAILPICEPGQVPGIDFENQKACKPAGISDAVLSEDYLKPIFPFILALVPNEIPIGEKWDEIQVTRNWGPFATGMALPASLMLISIFLGFLAASFWYLAALLADETWRVRLLWLGWMLIIPSALIFLTGLAASTDIPNYWINLGIERIGMNGIPFGIGIQDSIRAVISGSLSRVANSLMMVGGICSAVGLGFIFWGMATKK